MNRILTLLLAISLVLSGCGNKAVVDKKEDEDIEVSESENSKTEDTKDEELKEEIKDFELDEKEMEEEFNQMVDEMTNVKVNKDGLTVDLILPLSLYLEDDGELYLDDIKKEVMEEGIIDVKVNEKDGKIIFTMPTAIYEEMVEELKTEIDKSVKDIAIINDLKAIKKMETNEDYTTYDITVDKEVFELSFEVMYIMGVAYQSEYYHNFIGSDMTDFKVTINLIDASTGNIYETIYYPDDLGNEIK